MGIPTAVYGNAFETPVRTPVGDGPSHTHKLREAIEVLVSVVENQIVLQDDRCKPHVVRRNGRALLSQLAKHSGVVMRGLVIGKDDLDTVFQEETSENLLVLRLTATVGKAGAKLAEHDEWQNHRFGLLEQHHGLIDAFAEIDVSIGVEGNLQRQRPSST